MNIARYFDSAILKPDMTPEQVEAAIRESISFDSYSVCVRGCDIDLAVRLTKGTNTVVSCVLDFPYGYSGIETKRAAARDYDPSRINRYLTELAGDFHRFYGACRIKGEEESVLLARLKLADSVRSVLANGLGLLGVTAPEKM